MRKPFLLLVIFQFFVPLPKLVLASPQDVAWNKTETIKELAFCAVKLRTILKESGSRREVDILMEADQVTESNLMLLFRIVPEKYPKPLSLEVFVSTNIDQLKSLVTHMNMSGPSKEESEALEPESSHPSRQKGESHQWAYYKRTDHIELFRYNPNFPDPGMKTVILRGKE